MMFLRKRRVRVHLLNETRSVEGVWVGNSGGHYRLAAAQQLESDDRVIALDGEAWIPRERVLYMQVVG